MNSGITLKILRHALICINIVGALATGPAGAADRDHEVISLLGEDVARHAPTTTTTTDIASAEIFAVPPRANFEQTADAHASRDDETEALGGFLSEVRLGVLKHDTGPFSRTEEDGVNVNLELLFTSPGFLKAVWSPRPHLGVSINTSGDTNQAYFGLSWEFDVWRSMIVGFSLGGSVHDGETKTDRIDRKELGCHLLFRESLEIGWRFGQHHAITAFLDHMSNAGLCDKNEGLENVGVRYGYRF
jgi:lipid A 3-O-deacylase